MAIGEQLQQIKRTLAPANVTLIAVSKTQSVAAIREAYEAGQRRFGESRPQALCEKAAQLPADIEWHFIGHLQTNKVKLVTGLAHTIHSGDSPKLLRALNDEAGRRRHIQRCLLQVHIAQEAAKFGFMPDALRRLSAEGFFTTLPHLQIAGLMGMATFTDNMSQIRAEFRMLRRLFTEVKQTTFSDNPAFCERSMGMSGDYTIAVEEGSTMIRIGTLLFTH
ncbi:MAG: YggS family pyridoxal phosphate-dependent enzyme [Prevotellaceae bacterium]|jgi:pyridoxal phosphate enzyme (YggS family)|nr:YggS family pyridoxal phosphate-dependent enzyme [Prevotellaceae bacterium]